MGVLSAEEVNAFHKNGYVHLRGALSAAVIKRALNDMWKRLEVLPGQNPKDPSTWSIDTLGEILKENKRLRHNDDSRLDEAITQILGTRWNRPKHWGSLLLTVPDPSQRWNLPTSWHWDFEPLSLDGRNGVFVFTFLNNVKPRGGGTLVVSGSHELLLRFHRRTALGVSRTPRRQFFKSHPWLLDLKSNTGPKEGRVGRLMQKATRIDGIDVRVVELTGKPGDVVLCHPVIVHASSQNVAEATRLMLVKTVWSER